MQRKFWGTRFQLNPGQNTSIARIQIDEANSDMIDSYQKSINKNVDKNNQSYSQRLIKIKSSKELKPIPSNAMGVAAGAIEEKRSTVFDLAMQPDTKLPFLKQAGASSILSASNYSTDEPTPNKNKNNTNQNTKKLLKEYQPLKEGKYQREVEIRNKAISPKKQPTLNPQLKFKMTDVNVSQNYKTLNFSLFKAGDFTGTANISNGQVDIQYSNELIYYKVSLSFCFFIFELTNIQKNQQTKKT